MTLCAALSSHTTRFITLQAQNEKVYAASILSTRAKHSTYHTRITRTPFDTHIISDGSL